MRVNLALLFVIVAMFGGSSILGQSPNASISGVVLDPDKKSIAEAEILVVNDYTRVQYEAKTNAEGFFAVTNLPPGQYRIQVSRVGFKAIIKPDIVLNVQEALAVNFTLPIGASSVVVTVEGGAPMIDTTDASVSTVVDRTFVENIPLNGRSFQGLILLTPGIVTNSPQQPASAGISGEFSVNGQRTESNYYTVDGVSANAGINFGSFSGGAVSGSLPASTSLGTTQALVSVDALAEFRVQTSTYSAESGRNPGGQISFVTRSGTDQWHGTVFDYFRNDALDANDWFNNYYGFQKSAERQNDFGGTLGGPVVIPRIYNGKDRTFFFFSYEGLRLTQPQEASVSTVPTAALRAAAPSPLQPALDGFPLPNCPSSAANCSNDLGNGLGQYVGIWSNPNSIDSYSGRLDQAVNQRVRLFFRASQTPSTSGFRSVGSQFSQQSNMAETYTAGVQAQLSSWTSNDLRLNYSAGKGRFSYAVDGFAGALPVDLVQVQGIAGTSPSASVNVGLFFPGYSASLVTGAILVRQHQRNLVDTTDISRGRHHLRFGIDYRRLTPEVLPESPSVTYRFLSQAAVLANHPDLVVAQLAAPGFPIYKNVSVFVQDEWHPISRLTVSPGLRWELNPAPSAPTNNLPYTVLGDSNRSGTLTLAPEGTALWKTTWFNFAPRLGLAYSLGKTPSFETVVRGGLGVFFDTGQQLGSYGYNGPGFSSLNAFFSGFGNPASFPIAPSQAMPPIVNPPTTPYATTYAFSRHLQLPYTLQWNVSIAQALGKAQALSVSYVGATGRRLLEEKQISVGALNPSFQDYVFLVDNGLTSDYDALQVKFQRRLSGGLQALVSYTLAHAIDYGSFNSALPYARGNSDYDVRHSVSAGFTYDLPSAAKRGRIGRAVTKGWGLDGRLSARTAFPIALNGDPFINPITGQSANAGLDLIAGEPLYLHGSDCLSVYGALCPGGRAINPNAFAPPPVDPNSGLPARPGDAPRNFVRGFGAWQSDLAIRRDFPLYERLKLQLRAEAFNLLNHPSFGTVSSTYCSPGPGCTFGEATQTLAQSLGVASALYQMGGPRSMQLSLKLMF